MPSWVAIEMSADAPVLKTFGPELPWVQLAPKIAENGFVVEVDRVGRAYSSH